MFLLIFNAKLHQEKYWQTEVSGGGRRWSLFIMLYYYHQNDFALRVCMCVHALCRCACWNWWERHGMKCCRVFIYHVQFHHSLNSPPEWCCIKGVCVCVCVCVCSRVHVCGCWNWWERYWIKCCRVFIKYVGLYCSLNSVSFHQPCCFVLCALGLCCCWSVALRPQRP